MGWSGRKVTAARAHWRPLLPLPCRRCGKPVLPDPDSGWQVGHVIDRWAGGTDSLDNTWPEHALCNTRAGGKVGARITNARRAPAQRVPGETMRPERGRGIRGV